MTTFYFEVQRRKFREALDMFAQFFIDPLMAKSAMTRERQAVDSEYQMALPSDYNKKQQLLGSVAARPDHPLGKFMWGNQESLSKSGFFFKYRVSCRKSLSMLLANKKILS